MYIHITSDQNSDYFADNDSSAFRVKLPYTLNLNSNLRYEVALVQICTPSLKPGYKPNYITFNTNLCEASIINLSLRPILRLMHTEDFGKPIDYAAPQYVAITSHSVDVIGLYLSDDTAAGPSFEEGPIHATLHIRPKE